VNRALTTILLLSANCGSADSTAREKQPARLTAYELSDFPQGTIVREASVCTDENKCQLELPGVAAVASDGRVVLGGASAQLVQTDAQGQFARHIGRNGRGPGEYLWVVAGDFDADENLKVYDTGTSRITTFDRSGTLVSTTNVPYPPSAMTGAVFRSGTLYISVMPAASGRSDSVMTRLLRFDERAGSFEEIATKRTQSWAIAGTEFTRIPNFFEAPDLWDVDETGAVIWNYRSGYEIDRHSAGGVVTRFRVNTSAESVSKLDIERELNRRRGKPPHPPGLDAQLRSAADHAAKVFPAIDHIRSAPSRTVWIRRFAPAWSDSAQWDAFVNDKPAATIKLARNARILAGAQNLRMLVMELDELDVPRIGWYRVVLRN
jgi:hypothetical protein